MSPNRVTAETHQDPNQSNGIDPITAEQIMDHKQITEARAVIDREAQPAESVKVDESAEMLPQNTTVSSLPSSEQIAAKRKEAFEDAWKANATDSAAEQQAWNDFAGTKPPVSPDLAAITNRELPPYHAHLEPNGAIVSQAPGGQANGSAHS